MTVASIAVTLIPVSESEKSDYDLGSHPHDAFFKKTFSNPEMARAFFASHLPTELSKLVDLKTLKLVPGSFVKRTLQEVHSDLLFSTRMVNGRELLLYLLFEHQTKVDLTMPLRLLAYQTEILLRHHRKHGLPLAPVLPFVLHQGPSEWTVSTHFEDLFDLEESEVAFKNYLPKFQHLLLDLSQVDTEAIEGEIQVRIVLQLMKLARGMQVLDLFNWLRENFDQWTLLVSDPFIKDLLLYALHADSNLDVEEISLQLEGTKNLQKTMSSIAQRLLTEGRTEGRTEGKAEGRTEGEARGEVYGKIHLLEEFLGRSATSKGQLGELDLDQLEARFEELQSQYHATFKGS